METTKAAPSLPDYRTFTSMSVNGEAAVGRIAIWCAWLEQHLVDLCARLINGADLKIGYAVTANMTASNMVQLAKNLVTESTWISKETKTDTIAALTAAKAALVERNQVLHAPVGSSLTEGMNTFWNGKRKRFKDGPLVGQLEAVQRSGEELDAIGARIYKAMDDLFECEMDIHLEQEKRS